MTPENRIPLAAVIGDPVSHSRSPVLHGHWLARYGIAGHYIPVRVARGSVPSALNCLMALGFSGVNVTVPHKEAALAAADSASPAARRMGAANLLIFGPDGKIHADNSDGAGFVAHLAATAPGWRPCRGPAILLGAGGAARAIAHALVDAGVKHLLIANRSQSRAADLARSVGPAARVIAWQDVASALCETALLVNATSLGMTGQPPLAIDLDRLDPATIVADIVYAPLDTDLLGTAAARGCQTVDGLGMLLHQAVPAFEAFFGHRPVVDDALRQAVIAA
jgi:shikimate dehydrogenase